MNFLLRFQVRERLEMCRLCLFSSLLFIIFIILFISGTQSAVVVGVASCFFYRHEYLIFNSAIPTRWMDGRTTSFWLDAPPASVTTARTACARFPRDLLRRRWRRLIFMHGVSAALIHHSSSSSSAVAALPGRRPPDVSLQYAAAVPLAASLRRPSACPTLRRLPA